MSNTIIKEKELMQKAGLWDKYHQVACFFAAILICCGIYGYAVFLQNQKLEEGQQRIIATFEKHFEKDIDSNNLLIPSNAKFKQELEEREKSYEEIKSLLDLEFNKIQNEFGEFEIWAGVLTIIFLIFSFYSFFKTEQLELQGKNALRFINETQTKSDELLKTLEKEKTDKLNSIETSYRLWSRMKGDSIKKLLVKKSQEYQAQLSEEYKNAYEQKVLEITEGISSKVAETLDKLEKVSGEELQKYLNDWTLELEKVKNDFTKWKNEHFATDADIDQIFEVELEDSEDDESDEKSQDEDYSKKPKDDGKE